MENKHKSSIIRKVLTNYKESLRNNQNLSKASFRKYKQKNKSSISTVELYDSKDFRVRPITHTGFRDVISSIH